MEENIIEERRKLYKGGIALGVIGIVFGVLFPAVAYSCSIPGIVMSVKKHSRGYRTTGALALNIIAVAVAFANSTLAVIVTARGFTKKRTGEF